MLFRSLNQHCTFQNVPLDTLKERSTTLIKSLNLFHQSSLSMRPFHDKPLKYVAQPTNWFAPFSLILWNHIQSHTYEYTTTLFAIVSNYLIINEITFLITHMKNICESYIDPYF